MTSVICDEYKKGKYTIVIDGHSGYNPGNDIVCAACSVLTYTLINSLSKLGLKKYDVLEFEDGFVISLASETETQEKTKTIIDTIMLGFEMLQEQYPANVSVTYNIFQGGYL